MHSNARSAQACDSTPILTNDEATGRMLFLTRLQAALEPMGIHSVLARKHRLVLRYNQSPCPSSGLTDPELRIFINGRQALATTDGAFYRLTSGQQFPVTDPAAAAVGICQTRPVAVLAPRPCNRSSRLPSKDPGPGHQFADPYQVGQPFPGAL